MPRCRFSFIINILIQTFTSDFLYSWTYKIHTRIVNRGEQSSGWIHLLPPQILLLHEQNCFKNANGPSVIVIYHSDGGCWIRSSGEWTLRNIARTSVSTSVTLVVWGNLAILPLTTDCLNSPQSLKVNRAVSSIMEMTFFSDGIHVYIKAEGQNDPTDWIPLKLLSSQHNKKTTSA